MKDPRCGCCEGTEPLTPSPTANRPGLAALRYRAGTHSTFFETMVARLSSHRLDDGRRPLRRLTTRATDDPALALLDAWATVADVLTFYQERIANEGYLSTATERRSILELARLVGYRLRPGVAASVFLAFTLDDGFEVEIPAGTRARSLPGPDELPQAFETKEALAARSAWNAVAPRRSVPTFLRPDATFEGTRRFYLRGSADLKANDTVLFVCGSTTQPYTLRAADFDAEADHTLVTYVPFGAPFSTPLPDPPPPIPRFTASEVEITTGAAPPALTRLASVVQALRKDPSLPPASRFQLPRSLARTYGATSDLGPRLLAEFSPRLKDTLYTAYANAPITGVSQECHVEAMRVKGAPFGHNAPPDLVFDDNVLVGRREWDLAETTGEFASEEQLRTLSLDATYDEITPGSRVVVDRVDREDPIVAQVEQVRTISRAEYGMSAKVTQLVLSSPWLFDNDTFAVVRGTTVYAQSERQELAEEPLTDGVAGDEIELDGLYEGLEAGRRVVVKGERTDIVDAAGELVTGVEASELAMLAGVVHNVRTVSVDNVETELPTDTLHTRLILAERLAYTYRRDTVAVNANVVGATHGETRQETLGSGDASRTFQELALGQSPLTFVAATTPEGVESTLEVRVNEVRWPEQKTLLDLDGGARGYVTKTDDDGKTTVIFGDGRRGARLPTGTENVTAVYRSGIGKSGNVGAGAISNLATRPLGVKDVVNPQRASGGADPESRDQARRNAPLAVLALDRLVSVEDYAAFARTFAGIGKAAAASLSDGRRELVHLTVAGDGDAPIEASSDLYRNLLLALRKFGDPNVALKVAPREAVFIFISARVKVHADYLWEKVEPKVRAALAEALGFERRELAQDVPASEVVGLIQHVEGVAYVDLDVLDGVSETDGQDPQTLARKLEALAAAGTAPAPDGNGGADAQPRQRLAVEPARIDGDASDPALRLRPAQMAYLNADLPDTLILTEVTP